MDGSILLFVLFQWLDWSKTNSKIPLFLTFSYPYISFKNSMDLNTQQWSKWNINDQLKQAY